MKIPLPPPLLNELLRNLDSKQLSDVLSRGAGPLVNGRYLHWDELRHRAPPEGLASEAWWTGLKIARQGLLKDLPFQDKHKRPIRFGMPDPVLRALHEIDRRVGSAVTMVKPIVSSEDRDRYLVSSLIEEAITSSQLEGAATTREEAKAMLRSGRKPRDRSERMIVNNFRVMEHIRELRDEPLTPKIVLAMHRIVSEDTLDDPSAVGRLRRADEKVSVMDAQHSMVLHEPPPAASLPQRLDRLCAFANESVGESFVHPVIRAILLHYMLGYDHPFVDGNGRTARALFYWSLARSGYWLMEYVSISRLLKQAPAQYARAYLHSETDDNDTTYFILQQLSIIERAIDALYEYLARKTDEQRSAERLLRHAPALADRLNHRQLAILSHALKHPGHGYTVESHRRSHRVTLQTARTDLLALAKLKLLETGKRGRALVFYAPEGLRARIESAARKPAQQKRRSAK